MTGWIHCSSLPLDDRTFDGIFGSDFLLFSTKKRYVTHHSRGNLDFQDTKKRNEDAPPKRRNGRR